MQDQASEEWRKLQATLCKAMAPQSTASFLAAHGFFATGGIPHNSQLNVSSTASTAIVKRNPRTEITPYISPRDVFLGMLAKSMIPQNCFAFLSGATNLLVPSNVYQSRLKK